MIIDPLWSPTIFFIFFNRSLMYSFEVVKEIHSIKLLILLINPWSIPMTKTVFVESVKQEQYPVVAHMLRISTFHHGWCIHIVTILKFSSCRALVTRVIVVWLQCQANTITMAKVLRSIDIHHLYKYTTLVEKLRLVSILTDYLYTKLTPYD